MFNTKTEEWSEGPRMNQKRAYHSCFYDDQTNSIFVVGGQNSHPHNPNNNIIVATTEQWRLDSNQWVSTPSLPEPLNRAAGVASKSMDYIGFVVGGSSGGFTDGNITKKVLGLRRRDLEWEVMPQQLKTARIYHSIVSLPFDQIPGC